MNILKKNSHIFITVIAACLVAIWPLPGTIALRQFLLLTGLVLSIPVILANGRFLLKKETWPIWALASFFLWLLIHLAFFSVNISEQLHELQSDWLRSLASATIGLSLGIVLLNHDKQTCRPDSKKMELILIVGFSGSVTIFFLRYLYEIYATLQWVHKDFYMTPFKSKTPIVIFGGIFLPLIFIKFSRVLIGHEKPHWAAISFLGLFLVIFADYFANTKNGFAMLGFVLCIFIFNLIKTINTSHKNSRFILIIILSMLAITAIGAKKHVESNPAWLTLWSNIKIGVDIDRIENWKNVDIYSMPINELGVHVDGSTYERTAWAMAGLRLISENPQGYGLIHHSFGALAIKKWTDFSKPNGKTRGATHSGWIDFTLGLGVPGLLLVLIPLTISFFRALRMKGFWPAYIVWTVPTILFAYLITEVSSDHFIELLFFMTAFFCGITIKKITPPEVTPHLAAPEKPDSNVC